MESIQEIPLDTQTIREEVEEIPKEVDMGKRLAEEEPITPPPKSVAKAKGRPKGSKNVAPSKPRARKVTEKPLEEAPLAQSFAEEAQFDRRAYSPSTPRHLDRETDRRRIPQYGADDVAVEMLRLLTNQSNNRQSQKRALYASWFR